MKKQILFATLIVVLAESIFSMESEKSNFLPEYPESISGSDLIEINKGRTIYIKNKYSLNKIKDFDATNDSIAYFQRIKKTKYKYENYYKCTYGLHANNSKLGDVKLKLIELNAENKTAILNSNKSNEWSKKFGWAYYHCTRTYNIDWFAHKNLQGKNIKLTRYMGKFKETKIKKVNYFLPNHEFNRNNTNSYKLYTLSMHDNSIKYKILLLYYTRYIYKNLNDENRITTIRNNIADCIFNIFIVSFANDIKDKKGYLSNDEKKNLFVDFMNNLTWESCGTLQVLYTQARDFDDPYTKWVFIPKKDMDYIGEVLLSRYAEYKKYNLVDDCIDNTITNTLKKFQKFEKFALIKEMLSHMNCPDVTRFILWLTFINNS